MSLDGAITHLASWAGNTMMPTMAGMFFAGAVYRYSKGGPFENLLYGGFASLMCCHFLGLALSTTLNTQKHSSTSSQRLR